MPTEQEEKAHCRGTPGAPHQGPPDRGSGAGARGDAGPASGPGKLFFPFMTKGKMLCMILVQLIVVVGSQVSYLRLKKQSFKSSYSCLFSRGNTEVILQIGRNHGERDEACEVFHPLKSSVCRRAATCTSVYKPSGSLWATLLPAATRWGCLLPNPASWRRRCSQSVWRKVALVRKCRMENCSPHGRIPPENVRPVTCRPCTPSSCPAQVPVVRS